MSDALLPPPATPAFVPATLAEARILGAMPGDWLALLKPRVLTLVVFTGVIGMLMAPTPINPVLGIAAILCITIAAGAAGAINMWYDRDIDAVMRRTAKRPIPAGRITPEGALAFGVGLSFLSVLVMWMATNLLAAGILAVSIAFYVFVYTMWLKRRTPQNIVIGGAAGAFPPMIGWAAATGSLSALPLLMFAMIFLWTPPHFWAMSLFASTDYERAGVPMLPVVAGPRKTRLEVVRYTLWMIPVTLLPFILGLTGVFYGISAVLLNGLFLWHSVQVLRDDRGGTGISLASNAPAKAAFKYSILYLFLLFGALLIDKVI